MATLSSVTSTLRRSSAGMIVLRRFLSNKLSPNLLSLRNRGLIQTLLPLNSDGHFTGTFNCPRTLYCGFDPTADSLHLGNLLSIMVLMHAVRSGHRVIALVGGATAVVGDPSGRSTDRDSLDLDALAHNSVGVKKTLTRLFYNNSEMMKKKYMSREVGEHLILDNADWNADFSASKLAASIGNHLRLSDLLSKESVQRRLNTKQGMSVKEFLYPLFQANDWLHLFQKYYCLAQVGGNDQQGNIDVGQTLIRRVTNERVFGLTVPLLTTADGQKIGKSDKDKGKTIWLSEPQTPAFALFQHLLNTPDTEVERFLFLFTFLPDVEIQHIMVKQQAEPEKRFAQRRLAEEVLTLVHGPTGLHRAEVTTGLVFGNEDTDVTRAVSEMDLASIEALGLPLVRMARRPDVSLLQAVMATGYVNGEAEALELIRSRAVQVNRVTMTRSEQVLRYGIEILKNNVTVMRIGKKRFCLIMWFD